MIAPGAITYLADAWTTDRAGNLIPFKEPRIMRFRELDELIAKEPKDATIARGKSGPRGPHDKAKQRARLDARAAKMRAKYGRKQGKRRCSPHLPQEQLDLEFAEVAA